MRDRIANTPASTIVVGTMLLGEVMRIAWGVAQVGAMRTVRPKEPDRNRHYPSVSLIVPARNESATIDACLAGALSQTYPNLEIFIVDDCSTDDTADRVRTVEDSRVRLISGEPLPVGWAGKPWAMHQGVQASHGEWFLFVDADTQVHPGAITAVVDAARDGWISVDDVSVEEDGIHLFSVLTGQALHTWWERIIQPAILGGIMEALPVRLVNSPRWPWIALANGQFLLVRRDVYEAIGGYAAIRSEIAEDIMFAKRLKRMGYRIRLADGRSLATTRMYTSPTALWEGWTKNLHVGSRLLPAMVVPGVIGLLAVASAPWVLFIASLSDANRSVKQRLRVVACAFLALAMIQRRGVDRALGVPAHYVFAQPLGVIAMVVLMVASHVKVVTGAGVTWKGRRYAR